MREIKFRAFDKLKKKMQDVAGINWVEGIVMLWNQTGSARATYYVEIETVDLVQYTGLKDSTKWEQLTDAEQKKWIDSGKTQEEWNGVEIYEGDILLVPNNPTMSDPMGESDFCPVVMESGAFGYRQGSTFESFVSLYGDGCNSVDEEEVIGNIYENKELIKERK